MHIVSEVSSTTNSALPVTGSDGGGSGLLKEATTMHNRSNTGRGGASKQSSKTSANSSSNSALAPLTAENFAERTIDGLLAEHPGELVRTGCPHVVRRY